MAEQAGVIAGASRDRGSRSSVSRILARAAVSLLLAGLLLRLLQLRLDSLDLAAVRAAFAAVEIWQWLAALALTGLSFHAVGRYDLVLHRHLGTGADPGAARRAGIAAIAVSQTLGLGIVTGGLVRWRMLRDTTLWEASRLSALVALSFLGGWAMVTALVLLALPGAAFRAEAIAVTLGGAGFALTSLAAPRLSFRGKPLRWPNGLTLGALLSLAALDTLAAGGALWLLCPPGAAPPLAAFLPAFLLALGAGLVSGTPGGVGAFEMTLLVLLPTAPEAPLLAAVLAWRGVYYALPALLGAAAFARGARPVPRALPLPPASHGPAEAGLARQGRLSRLRVGKTEWLAGRTPHLLVALLDPFRPDEAALPALIAQARAEARLPCLYKCSARTAVMARRAGYSVLPVAREAWLVPGDFRLEQPGLAGLRRKLRKAAGVRIERAAALPLDEMQRVAEEWARGHGGERGFSMGRWCPDYVAGQRVYLAREGARLLGFVSFHEGPGRRGGGEWALDLMRHSASAPDGTMQALIVHAIAEAAAVGIGRLSLAAVPLPLAMPDPVARQAHRLLGLEKRGLEQFKAGFAPQWDRLYLAAPSRAALLLAGVEIAREIHAPHPPPAKTAENRPPSQDDHEEYAFAPARPAWQSLENSRCQRPPNSDR